MCFHFSCRSTEEWNGRIVSIVYVSLLRPDCFPKCLWPLHISAFPLFCAQLLSHVQLFVTPWIVARQLPLSLEFSRQEYWSGLPFLPSKYLPNPGFNTLSVTSPTSKVGFFPMFPLVYDISSCTTSLSKFGVFVFKILGILIGQLGSGGPPGEESGNLLQYSCLGNPMDREAWRATVQGFQKGLTWLTN